MKPRPLNPFSTRTAPNAEQEYFRSMEFDRATVNEDARTVELSFSSENEVERWFGIEVLDHTASSVRMGRLNEGGPLLVNHDRNDQVGVIERAWIDTATKRGRAIVRFGRSARANEIFQDVADGIRRLVSVGYRIFKMVTTTAAGGVETERAIDWEPYEISLVSIPADTSVGVGRSGEQPTGPTPNNPTLRPHTTMNRARLIAALRARGVTFSESATDAELQGLLDRSLATDPVEPVPANQQRDNQPRGPPADPHIQIVRENPQSTISGETHAQRAIVAERQRVAEINAISDQLSANGVTLDRGRAIADGVDSTTFRQQAFDALLQRGTSYVPGQVSATERRDLDRFSIVRGLSILTQGRALDGIEAEMQQEAMREARESGVNLEGNFHIPGMVLNHRRDMTATGGTNGDQGGTTIETNLGSFIELLYARLVLRGLGAQVLTGLVGNLDLPRLVTGSTVANKAENAAGDESSPTTGLISLRPNRATTFVELSQQLLIQSSSSVEQLVRNDLITQLSLLIEQRAISGTGANNQPLGILGTAGIGSVVGGANGGAITWDNVVDLETLIATVNADIGSLAYLTNPKVRGKLKKTSLEAGTNAERIWQKGTEPLNGYRAAVTTQVPSNLTKGTSNGVCSALIFGNYSDLILAQWGGLSLMANPYAKDTEGLVRITLNAYHDSVVRRPASFAAMQDALTV